MKKVKTKDLEPVFDMLKKLEVALRTNPSAWVEEFCEPPAMGHVLIIKLLEDLPRALQTRIVVPVLQRLPVR